MIRPFDLPPSTSTRRSPNVAICSCASGATRLPAACVTIEADRIADFAARFNDVARERLTLDDLAPDLRVDPGRSSSNTRTAIPETVLRHLEPCGIGNPSPLLVVRGVTIEGSGTHRGPRWPQSHASSGRARPRSAPSVGEWRIDAGSSRERSPWTSQFKLERDEERRLAGAGAARGFPARVDTAPHAHRRRSVARSPHHSTAPGDAVRPTADRVREAWMSIVATSIPGSARPRHLFAGSGALGLEVRCRAGAAVAEFVETDPRHVAAIRANRGVTPGPRTR